MLRYADLPMDPWHQFLLDLSQAIPAMNKFCYYSIQNDGIISLAAATDREREMLNIYQSLQYNGLIDQKKKNSLIFPTPL